MLLRASFFVRQHNHIIQPSSMLRKLSESDETTALFASTNSAPWSPHFPPPAQSRYTSPKLPKSVLGGTDCDRVQVCLSEFSSAVH